MHMRQTGRTTRMLDYAADMKSRGHRVLVVVFPQQRQYVLGLIRHHGLDRWLTPHDLCTPAEAFERRMRGMDPNYVFADHYVFERAMDGSSRDARRFMEELSMLQRTWPHRMEERIAIPSEEPPPDAFCDCELH